MNYLLIGFNEELLQKIQEDLEFYDENIAYLLTHEFNKYLLEYSLKRYNIDRVIVEGLENFKITNSSLEIRYLENYRYLIDICIKNYIDHLHIIEKASKIYQEFLKPSRDYRYKENDDIYSNDLESLNHLFIRKYAEHISSTSTLNITISRYNELYPRYFIDLLVDSIEKNKPIEYVENNIKYSYTNIVDASRSIIELLSLEEFGIYNLPNSLIGTKTEVFNHLLEQNKIEKINPKVQQLKNMSDSYVLDDSKILDLLKKTSN